MQNSLKLRDYGDLGDLATIDPIEIIGARARSADQILQGLELDKISRFARSKSFQRIEWCILTAEEVRNMC